MWLRTHSATCSRVCRSSSDLGHAYLPARDSASSAPAGSLHEIYCTSRTSAPRRAHLRQEGNVAAALRRLHGRSRRGPGWSSSRTTLLGEPRLSGGKLMSVRPFLRGAALLAATVLVTSCGSGDTGSSEDAAASSSPSGSGASPVTVQTAFGPVEVPEEPERVVALGWSDAE